MRLEGTSKLARGARGIRIEVNAGEAHGEQPAARPRLDAAQHVATAGADVDYVQLGSGELPQPVQRGPVSEQGAVHGSRSRRQSRNSS